MSTPLALLLPYGARSSSSREAKMQKFRKKRTNGQNETNGRPRRQTERTDKQTNNTSTQTEPPKESRQKRKRDGPCPPPPHKHHDPARCAPFQMYDSLSMDVSQVLFFALLLWLYAVILGHVSGLYGRGWCCVVAGGVRLVVLPGLDKSKGRLFLAPGPPFLNQKNYKNRQPF